MLAYSSVIPSNPVSAPADCPRFIAKNIGARRARGQYLLFTNADDLFPVPLVEMWVHS